MLVVENRFPGLISDLDKAESLYLWLNMLLYYISVGPGWDFVGTFYTKCLELSWSCSQCYALVT